MKVIDTAAVREALPFERLIPALRVMFARGCDVPKRHVHQPGGHFTSLIMPAWTTGPGSTYYGIKTINIAPGNAARGLPGLHASYLLHDAQTGIPLALIDGDEITARRTAAASALAASWLTHSGASHLLVVGTGRVASLLPHAYRVVRPIARVTVWARAQEKARALVEAWRAQGFDAHVADDLEVAARQADIVSCATLATSPVMRGAWLRPDSHLDLIGSFTPARREADDDCFTGASIWVDTEEALEKSGDLIGPMQRGVFSAGDVCGSLSMLARGEVELVAGGRTVFKSVGTALEDLAAAILVYTG